MNYYLIIGTENTSTGSIFKEIFKIIDNPEGKHCLEYTIIYDKDSILDYLSSYNKVVFIYRKNPVLAVLASVYYNEYLIVNDTEVAVKNVKQRMLKDNFSDFNKLLSESIELNKVMQERINALSQDKLVIASEDMRGEGYSNIIKSIVKFLTGKDISYKGDYSKLIRDKVQLEELEVFVKENNV